MAYHIFYYADRAMTRRLPDYDRNVGDWMTTRPPSVSGAEVAEAIHSTDPWLNFYGYGGAWHKHPPA